LNKQVKILLNDRSIISQAQLLTVFDFGAAAITPLAVFLWVFCCEASSLHSTSNSIYNANTTDAAKSSVV